jgi:hypothetical protein
VEVKASERIFKIPGFDGNPYHSLVCTIAKAALIRVSCRRWHTCAGDSQLARQACTIRGELVIFKGGELELRKAPELASSLAA